MPGRQWCKQIRATRSFWCWSSSKVDLLCCWNFEWFEWFSEGNTVQVQSPSAISTVCRWCSSSDHGILSLLRQLNCLLNLEGTVGIKNHLAASNSDTWVMPITSVDTPTSVWSYYKFFCYPDPRNTPSGTTGYIEANTVSVTRPLPAWGVEAVLDARYDPIHLWLRFRCSDNNRFWTASHSKGQPG